MSVTLTGTGGLFTRLGGLWYLAASQVNQFRTDLSDNLHLALEQFDAEDNATIRAVADQLNSAAASAKSGLGGIQSTIRTAARNLLIEQVHADNPLPTKNVQLALAELRRQMIGSGDYVAANTLGASTTRTNLDGDGLIVTSTLDGSGVPLENLIAEDLELTCLSSTAGAEQIQVLGELAEVDKLSHLWPKGSGASSSLSAVSPGGSADLVQYGGFSSGGSAPAGWTVSLGSGILSTPSGYSGNCLQFAGDGATQTLLKLTLSGLVSKVPYALCFWAKRSTAGAQSGQLEIELHDTSAAIADEQGTDNTYTVDIDGGSIGTSWAPLSAVFRLPEPLPATVEIRITTTAIANSTTLSIDHLTLSRMAQPLSSVPGHTPFMAACSGATAWSLDDRTYSDRVFKTAVTNNRTGAWQQAFDQFFDASLYGLTLPTSGGGAEIAESLLAPS